MSKRYYHLVLALLAAAVLLHLPPGVPLPPAKEPRFTDAESLLALGKKIDFCRAGIYELELLPQVSDRLAQSILRRNRAVRRAAHQLPAHRRHEALELVHGIGPKRSRALGHYLELRCRGGSPEYGLIEPLPGEDEG